MKLKILGIKKMQSNLKNYNKKFTEIEIQIIEDQTRKQIQELDSLFSGNYYESK